MLCSRIYTFGREGCVAVRRLWGTTLVVKRVLSCVVFRHATKRALVCFITSFFVIFIIYLFIYYSCLFLSLLVYSFRSILTCFFSSFYILFLI
jgi:hypothetical protein